MKKINLRKILIGCVISVLSGLFMSSSTWAEDYIFTDSADGISDEDLGNLGDESEEISDEVMGEIYLQGEFLDGDILKISVQVRDMQAPTLGAAFHLIYDPTVVTFLRYDPGNFLERGGDPFYLVTNGGMEERSEVTDRGTDEAMKEMGATVANGAENGNLVFGVTLRRNDSFPVGEGKISDFYFQILEGEVFDFKFENGVVSTLETVRQDINNITWTDLLLDKNKMAANPLGNISAQIETSNFGINFSLKIMAIILAFLAFASVILVFWYLKRRQGVFKESVNFK